MTYGDRIGKPDALPTDVIQYFAWIENDTMLFV